MRVIFRSRMLGAGALVLGALVSSRAEATVALAPTSTSLYPTQSASVTATVSTAAPGGLPKGVHTLTVSGLPLGVATSPAILNYFVPVVGVPISSTPVNFQIFVGLGAVAGTYRITISDPTVGGSAVFSLTILEPQLHLTILTPVISLSGSTVNVSVRVTSDPGFGANSPAGVPVVFGVDTGGAPANVTAGGPQTLVQPFSGPLTYPFRRTGPVVGGSYLVPLTATWTGTTTTTLTATANLTLNLPDIAVSVGGPPALNVCNGGLTVPSPSVTFSPLGNYQGTPSVGVLTAPAGVTVTPPAIPVLPPSQTVVFQLTGSGAPVGGQVFTAHVFDANAGVDHPFSVPFQVINPAIVPLAAPSALSLQAGGPAQPFSVSATGPPRECNSTPAVTVSLTGLPAGFVVPTPVTLQPPGYPALAMAVSAGANVASGTYPATLHFAPAVGAAKDVPVSILVTAAPPTPDFALTALPASLTLTPGSSGKVTFTVTPSGGFNSPVTLTVPPNSNVSADPASVTFPAAGGSAVVTFTASPNASAATIPITVSAAGGAGTTVSHTVSVTVVVAAPDFTLTAVPNALTLTPGSSGKITFTVTPSGGFNSPVTLTVPPNSDVSADPASVTFPAAGGSAVVTFTASPNASAATIPVTVSAAGGTGTTVSHTVSVTVVVQPPAADFIVRVLPPAPSVPAGRTTPLSFVLDAIGSFTGSAALTAIQLPPGATLSPASLVLTPAVPQTASLAVPRATPPGTYTLVFRADEIAAPAARRALLISKTVSVPLVVQPAVSGFTVIVSPTTVLASPDQAVAVRYTFQNLGDAPVTITGDSFFRRGANGTVFDSTEETVGVTLPARGSAIVSNTVLATGEQFGKAGNPPIVLADRVFRAAPDATGYVDTATATVTVTAANSLIATASATRISIVYPPSGTLVGRGDSLRAQGLVIGSGTGNLLVGWFFDGVLVETATVPLQNGTPTSVSNAISLPTLISGNHDIALSVLAPNTLSSPSVQIYVEEGQRTLRLVSPSAGAAFAPALGAPTFSWIPVPGIARYGVGLRRRTPEARWRWAFTTDTRWSPPASLWNSLPEGEYEWGVRGYTNSGRVFLDSQSGGASAPPTSEGSLDMAEGWTVTSAQGRFSLGGGEAALPNLEGHASATDVGVRFTWKEFPGALYVHTLYEQGPEGARRVRTEMLNKTGLLIPTALLPRGGPFTWRVSALDKDGRPLGSMALAPVPAVGGAR